MAKKKKAYVDEADREDEGYSRISEDDKLTELGVERQETGGNGLRERLGLPPIKAWTRENDVSASEYSNKPRPDFLGLVQRVRADKVRSITAYSQERITRREDEWMIFAHFCREHDVTIYLENRGGKIDITTATGKLTSGLFALLGAYESSLISERSRNANDQRRTFLLLPSRCSVRAFGFETDGYTHRPYEAKAIREAAPLAIAAFAAGESPITAIRAYFKEHDVRPVKVAEWSIPSLRSAFLKPRVAGLIEHDGEILGEGNFVPILDRATWDAVCEALAVKAPRPDSTARKHLLVGFLVCGKCANTLVSRGAEKGRNNRYGCAKHLGGCGSISRQKHMVDRWVDDWMDAWLEAHGGDPDVEDLGEDEASLADQLADVEAEIAVLDEQKRIGELAVVDWVRGMKPLRAAVIKLGKERAQARKARAAAEHSVVDPRETWRHGTLEQRRTMLRATRTHFLIKPVGSHVGCVGGGLDSIEAVPA